MESRLRLFSLPLEIREEIYFHLIALTFGTCYIYDKDLGCHILRPMGVIPDYLSIDGIGYGDPSRSNRRNGLVQILTVNHQMKAEVQSVLYQRFSLFFDDIGIREGGANDLLYLYTMADSGLVRNLVWRCRMAHDPRVELLTSMQHREIEGLSSALPGLRQVDLLLGFYEWAEPVAEETINFVSVFKHVPKVTVYLDKGLEKHKQELEAKMKRKWRFQVKILSSSIEYVIFSFF
jgi:hypothetical protein